MPGEAIGGFYAQLDLLVNEAAFRKGEGLIGNISRGLGGLLSFYGGLAGLTGGLGAFLAQIDEVQAKMIFMAAGAGLSTEELDNWRHAVTMAGGNADAFQAALTSMNAEFVRVFAMGETPSANFMKALGLLGLDFGKEGAKSQAQRTRDVLQAALDQPMAQMQETAQRVKELLGDTGMNFYLMMVKTGNGLDYYLGKAEGIRLISTKDRLEAADFMTQIEALKGFGGEGLGLFAIDVMRDFTPHLKDLLEYIRTHKGEISQAIQDWADRFANIAKLLGPIGHLLELMGDLAGIIVDWTSGKKDIGKELSALGEKAARYLIPQGWGDWANEKTGGHVLTEAEMQGRFGYGIGGKSAVDINLYMDPGIYGRLTPKAAGPATVRILQSPSGGAH